MTADRGRSQPDEGSASIPEIGDLAAIGDGRTVALVQRDGAIPWLPLPSVDGSTVFGTLLDPRAGSFVLSPAALLEVRRSYLSGTNVLETTFRTRSGAARITDALTLPLGGGLIPFRELVRKIEGIDGSVGFEWRIRPRFGYGLRSTRLQTRSHVPVAVDGDGALAIGSWDAGAPGVDAGAVGGSFTTSPGSSSVLSLSYAAQEPMVFPARREVERRLDLTIDAWRSWSAALRIEGPWEHELMRSALVLKLLVQAPTGAVAAAATTSLPEAIGAERNWDYRFCWVRDAAFVMAALLDLGCVGEAEAYFWWLMHASQITRPRLQVLYRLDGRARAPERELPLDGYRGSRPVRVGNAAVEQLQLDIYGDVVQTAWLYARAGEPIDPEFGDRLAEIADLVCELWPKPDAGIWEVRGTPRHFTHSKMMCWVALDRAIALSETGHLPGKHAGRWRRHAGSIETFVEGRCWSERAGAYTMAAGSEDLDASVLLGIVYGYGPRDRQVRTIDAVRRGLGRGPLVYRYVGADGLGGQEGAFLCCSFWLAQALAVIGRVDEAARLMDELVPFANDVGLYAEEVDPGSSGLLGNFPQALTHLSLITAASEVARQRRVR